MFPNNGREDNCDFTECGFKEMVTLDNNTQNYNPMSSIGEERVKRVNITIEPALTGTCMKPIEELAKKKSYTLYIECLYLVYSYF